MRRGIGIAFLVAAGVAAGGFGGYRLGRVAGEGKDKPFLPVFTASAAGDSLQYTSARVLGVDSAGIVVQAEIWPGQSLRARFAAGAAQLFDSTGVPVTGIAAGQKIFIKAATGIIPQAGELSPPPRRLEGSVSARVLRVIDGDTFEAEAVLFGGARVRVDVRVGGIDTPEKKGRAGCAAEAALAERASAFARTLLSGGVVQLADIGEDKYGGRVVCDVIMQDGRRYAAIMTGEGLARPYDGGAKQGWCEKLTR